MEQPSHASRLCNITTLWSVVLLAHAGEGEGARAAQRRLLDRYGGAVRRYLIASLRDRDAAEELFQEFALRFLSGDFKKAAPDRGRFRDYVKTVLYHQILRHRKPRKDLLIALPPDTPEPAAEPPADPDFDPGFARAWREDLLARCWEALAEGERQGGPPHHTALRLRTEHPTMPSAQMAERLGEALGKPVSATACRQVLHRARDRFAELILDEVTQALAEPTEERLAEELIELGLFEHCRGVFQRRGPGG